FSNMKVNKFLSSFKSISCKHQKSLKVFLTIPELFNNILTRTFKSVTKVGANAMNEMLNKLPEEVKNYLAHGVWKLYRVPSHTNGAYAIVSDNNEVFIVSEDGDFVGTDHSLDLSKATYIQFPFADRLRVSI